jgi:hypothetical protein
LDIANNILDIPLLEVGEDDKLVWYDETFGQYSVKSANNMMLNIIGMEVKIWVLKKNGSISCMLHQRLNTCFGEFAKGVFQPEFGWKKGVSLVHWYVLFMSIVMRMIDTFYLIVMTAC